MTDDTGESSKPAVKEPTQSANAVKIARLRKRLDRRSNRLRALEESMMNARLAALYEAMELLQPNFPAAANALRVHILGAEACPETFRLVLEQIGKTTPDE